MATLFFDFDSTLVSKESIDEAIGQALALHPDRARMMREVEAITRAGMEGKMPFTESVLARMKVAPLTKELLDSVGLHLREHQTNGMREVFDNVRSEGHAVYIVSGGFLECISPVAQNLGVPRENIFTNRFLFNDDGTAIGVDESAPLWTNEGKTPILRLYGAQNPGTERIMIGDGYNDLRAYENGAAEHFIGYGEHAVREAVKSKAPHFAHSSEELLTILENLL